MKLTPRRRFRLPISFAALGIVGVSACDTGDTSSGALGAGGAAGNPLATSTATGGSPAGGSPAGGSPAGGSPTGGRPAITAGGGAGGAAAVPTRCMAPTPSVTFGNACPGAPPPRLQLTEVASGLDDPLFVTQVPGETTRLLVVEQPGTIRFVENGSVTSTFLDITDRVTSQANEQGLLGFAFDPDYLNNGRVWVDYSGRNGGDTIISSFVGTPGLSADPNSEQVLLRVTQPETNHNGGMLAFGPDGCLFVAMGDGGGGGDPDDEGQNPNSQLATLLRLDVEHHPTPAPGNMAGAHPDVWAYGLRNPWRFSFDRQTGDLYIGDVGQNALEEINVAPRGVVGRNYGWNSREGFECYSPSTNCQSEGLTPPVVDHGRSEGQSITGGYVYRGRAIPALRGRYIYGDYGSNRVFSFVWSGERGGAGTICDAHELTADLGVSGGLTSFGEDTTGELYVVVRSGRVYRIDAR